VTATINCPLCSIPIGRIGNSGLFKGICTSCKFQYGAVYGKLSGRFSQQLTLRRETSKQSRVYQRQYELRIKTLAKKLEVFTFSTPGKGDWISVRRGDIVSVLFTRLLAKVYFLIGREYRILNSGVSLHSDF
jgi:hypothetical protein